MDQRKESPNAGKEKQSGQGRNLHLRVVGASIPMTILLAIFFDIPQRFVISYIVVAVLVFGAMALWAHANAGADGTEWWQDDDASGWRGY